MSSERDALAHAYDLQAPPPTDGPMWLLPIAAALPSIGLFSLVHADALGVAFWSTITTPFAGLALLFVRRVRWAGVGLVVGSLVAWWLFAIWLLSFGRP